MQHLSATSKLALQGATVLTSDGWLDSATVLIEDGIFLAVDQRSKPNGFETVNVTGLHLLPGIVDIHGGRV